MSTALTKPAEPARDRVYDFVRTAILRRDAKPGTFLEEEYVSNAVGVSRTPVREAFHRLAAEGWIDLLPRRGARIRQVTAQELVDVYEVRRIVEIHAARRLCHERRPVPPRARDLLAAMQDESAAEIAAQVHLDQQFHRSLVASADNEVLIEMYDGLRARQQRVALSALGADPTRLRIILEEHAALLAALDAHDAPGAERILERHLRPLAEIMSRLGA